MKVSALAVSMSAAWLKIASFLCLCYIQHTSGEKKEVVWKEVGESITITCSSSSDQEYMTLYTGLNKEVQLVFTDKNSDKTLISNEIRSRVQTYREFPKVSIFIRNLSRSDTGPYRCVYKKYSGFNEETTPGDGSLLLVVTEKKGAPTVAGGTQQCEPSEQNLVVVAIVITAAVLFCIVFGCIVWIIFKTKPSCSKPKPRPIVSNDVYEDMRGTHRC